jgi:hypothetical protein
MSTFDKRLEVTIDLEFPVTIDGDTLKFVTIRRPKVADTLWARRQKGDQVEQNMALLARLCKTGEVAWTPEHVAELDEYDATKVQEQYESFRGGAS